MKAIEAYLTTIYAAAISGKPCDIPLAGIDGDELFALAEAHGIASALYYPLKDTALAPFFEKAHVTALEKESLRIAEEERVFTAFDDADISYLPLKDSVLRLYYPTPDMRGEACTDLVVDPFARKAAEDAFKAAGYRPDKDGVYLGKGGKAFELHSKPDDASDFHKKLMERAVPVSEQANRHALS